MNPQQIVPLFSQPLYINKIDITQDNIEQVINTPCQSDNGGYNNGWMSQTQWLTTQPEIRSIIEEHLSEYVFNTLAVDNSKHQLEHTSSWVNKHVKGDKGDGHSHTNSMFSGCLYFKVPPNSGELSIHVGFKKNRAIFFDPSVPHTSTNTTNAKRRVNININYF